MTDKPKGSSEISHNLGLDQLKDESKRKQVEAYFQEKKGEIGEVSKGRRKELQDVMREMNRVKAGPDKIIAAIMSRLFKSALEKDISGRYAKQFNTILDAESVDIEGTDDDRNNPVRRKAMALALTAIKREVEGAEQRAKKFMKRDPVHKFAEALIRDYVKKMDDKAETLGWGVLRESELPELKPITFAEWLGTPARYTDEQLYHNLSAVEAKQFVGDIAKVKAELTKIDPKKAGMDKALAKFFQDEAARIESDAMVSQDAAISALDDAQKLGKSFTSALAIVKQRKDTEAKLNEAKNLKDKLPDFDVSIEEGYKKFIKDIDAATAAFIAKKGVGELTIQTKVLDDLNKKLAAEKERAAKGAAAQQEEEKKKEAEKKAKENEPPDPFKQPDEWLTHMGKEMGPIGGLLMAFIAGSPMWEKFKKYMGKLGKKKGALEKAPRMVKVQGFLRTKFDLKGEEALALLELKVSDLLKGKKAPQKVRQKPFIAFQDGLKNNGATEGTAGTVLDFVEKKQSSWKDTSKKSA